MVQVENAKCFVCRGATRADSKIVGNVVSDKIEVSCEACGTYHLTGTAQTKWFGQVERLSNVQRAALSHHIRILNENGHIPVIDTYLMDEFIKDARLPSISKQVINIIKIIGDFQLKNGGGYLFDCRKDVSLIGSLNIGMAIQLFSGLLEKKLIMTVGSGPVPGPRGRGSKVVSAYGLTIDGWERYEAERHGKVAGRYGFIAMKFGDGTLENIVENVIKPGIKEHIGYEIFDLRSVSRAGVIDNILREQIRDSDFVLADLTHDNSGAYWEAGYAEGLGKPVIYLCEKGKFNEEKTHFDTNHCTTVMWDLDNTERFIAELVATIRRSLNMF